MRTEARADVILHPQRMAVLRALAVGPRTVKQLRESLPTVPQATLYRHVAVLADAGVIEVVDERQSRGAVEKTYALPSLALVTGDDLANATADDHFRYFATFVAGLLGEYSSYLARDDIDLERDGVGYREHALHLSDDELLELLRELRAVIDKRSANAPSPDRTPRLLATVSMPLASAAPAALDAPAATPTTRDVPAATSDAPPATTDRDLES